MRSRSIVMNWPPIVAATFGVLLAACGSPQSSAPASGTAAAESPSAPQAAVVEPTEVATVDLPVVKMTAAVAGGEPELSTMRLAQSESSKLGVPVDLRYQIDGDAMSGLPVTVHLAAVPRSAGTNLAVSVKEEPGIVLPKQTLNALKAEVATPYRQQLQLTRAPGGPRALRVLVTMDFPIGQGFTWFTVPLDGTTSAKQPADRLQ